MKKIIMPVMAIIMILGIFFAYQGVSMHAQVAEDEATFHALQAEYFGQAKSVRDAAEAGSSLNQKLVTIQQSPSALMELKLIGVGKILTGIFVLLFGIMIALIIMPVRLGQIMKK